MSWSMKKDRELLKLAGAKLGVDRIAAKLEASPIQVIKVAKRLCIKLGLRQSQRGGRFKAKGK
jgi:hypothetical protein